MNIRGNGVEDIGCRNEGDEDNETVGEDIDDGDHSPILIHVGSLIHQICEGQIRILENL